MDRVSAKHKAPAAPTQKSCIIQYDGASKGNPGQAGAVAVIRDTDGTTVARLAEGVGNATNNVAEYRAALLGLKYARENGYKNVCIQGDSQLVTNQVQGRWKTRNPNMADLCNKVKGLKEQFTSFEASHVPRGYNYDADVQANRGVYLKDGEVQVVTARVGSCLVDMVMLLVLLFVRFVVKSVDVFRL